MTCKRREVTGPKKKVKIADKEAADRKSTERIARSQATPRKPALGHERLLADGDWGRVSLLAFLQLLVLHLGAEFGRPALGGVPVAEAVQTHGLGVDAGTVCLS